MRYCILSGGFDICHTQHLQVFKEASIQFDKVVVLLNSDQWLIDKKGFYFLNFNQRVEILKSIKYVDMVFPVVDTDTTVCETLKQMRELFPNDELYFGNGGDRKADNTPEVTVCQELGIECIWNLGNTDSSVHSSKIFEKAFEKKLNSMGYFIENGKLRMIKNGKYISE